MKKIVALLAVVMMLLSSASADELFRFADIDPATPFTQMKSALEKATGLKLSEIDGGIQSVVNPPITFMQMPVTLLEASSDQYATYISVHLENYEIDSYDAAIAVAFDDGRYDVIREKADDRFGEPAYVSVTFENGEKQAAFRVDNPDEYATLVNDAAIWMFSGGYKTSYVEFVRKNVIETFGLVDFTDPAVYGNVLIAIVYPKFTFCSGDLERAIRIAKGLGRTDPVFPVLNGVVQYSGDF